MQALPILKRSNHLLRVFNPELLVKGAPTIPTKKTLMIVREVLLTKSNAELLIFRLKQWDLLDDSVRITSQRKRHVASQCSTHLKMGYATAKI